MDGVFAARGVPARDAAPEHSKQADLLRMGAMGIEELLKLRVVFRVEIRNKQSCTVPIGIQREQVPGKRELQLP